MLAAPLAEEALRPLLGAQLSIAAINDPSVCVVAGPVEAIVALEQQLVREGLACRRLQTTHAFHSTMLEPIRDALAAIVQTITLSPPQIPYVSNVTGTWITSGEALDPAYWARHMCEPVRFAEGVRTLWQNSEQIVLEVGPGQALTALALAYAETDSAPDRVAFSSIRAAFDRRQSDQAFVLTTLGRLWLAGAAIDWNGFYAAEQRRRAPAPTYPFERHRHWIAPLPLAQRGNQPRRSLDKKHDIADWSYLPSWRCLPLSEADDAAQLAQQRRRWLIFLDGHGLGSQLATRLTQSDQLVITVAAGQVFEQSGARAYTLAPGQREDYQRLLHKLREHDEIPERIIHLWTVTPSTETPLSPPDDRAIEMHGFYSLLFLAQALGSLQEARPIHIGVVSTQLQDVTGDETLNPAKATVIGPCRVIPKEYAAITCQSIDIVLPRGEGSAAVDRLTGQLLAELLAAPAETLVAYRRHHRWVQRYESVRMEHAQAGAPGLREEGVYLITGGLGAIGLALAEYLAREARARLVLVGRTPLPERGAWDGWLATHDAAEPIAQKIWHVREIEALGGVVLPVQADVTDLEAMRRVCAQAAERFGAIHGVIHAAGSPAGGLIQLKTPEMAELTLAAKVAGARVLDTLFPDGTLDFLVLCSSLTAILGQFGQVDYCSANAFLDAFARHKHASGGTHTVAINWDSWKEAGQTVEAARTFDLQGWYAESLKTGLLSAEGVEVFRRAIQRQAPQVVISTRDLDSVIAYDQQLATHMLAMAAEAPGEADSAFPRSSLVDMATAPRDDVEAVILSIWQQLLRIDHMGLDDNFFDLGGNSLIGLKLVARINSVLQLSLPVVTLFEQPTVRSFAASICQGQSEDAAYQESLSRSASRKQKLRDKRQRKHLLVEESTNA